MGGAMKRMLHPYEVLDFSFEDLCKIMLQMFDGSIDACEKVDGTNMTWKSDLFGSVMFARNHGHIKEGGLGYHEMAELFDNHPAKDQFLEGLNAISNKAAAADWVHVLDDVWLNTEIVSSRFPQAFKYDTSALVIHNAATFVDGNVEQFQSEQLTKYIEHLAAKKTGWKVYGRLDIKLEDRLSEGHYDNFIADIRSVLRENSPSDADLTITISDYVWEEIFMKLISFDVISTNDASSIADSIVKDEAFSWKHLVEKHHPKFNEFRELCIRKNRDKVVSHALIPLQKVWEKYCAKVLEPVKSHLIEDIDVHRERMQELIDWNFEELAKRMEDPDTKDDKIVKLWIEYHTHLARYESLGVKPPAIEGIVFKHPKLENKLLKITGAFPSINRVVGVVRYGLGIKKQ